MKLTRITILALPALLCSCIQQVGGEGERCSNNGICLPGLVCGIDGTCRSGGLDGGTGGQDGGSGSQDGGSGGQDIWEDSLSGLVWLNPATEYLTYDEALSYCNGLSWNGHDDWRLPTVSEMRSLIRGCPRTQTDGACGVTDSCLEDTCVEECVSCGINQGPGEGGCYWDASLGGLCGYYWSSSSYADDVALAWVVGFDTGGIQNVVKTNPSAVRCVRGVLGSGCTPTCSGKCGGASDDCSGTCPDPCNGYGTCAAGACTCGTGYAAPSCSSCAAGYAGYPNCVLCSGCCPSPTGKGGDMCDVPTGAFMMGCNVAVDAECFQTTEDPYHSVDLPAFRIDKYEVTALDYKACVTANWCTPTRTGCSYNAAGKENHPINCVDWKQAKAYCTWAGKRLPTEAEWEKAARGTDGRKYPWGNAVVDCNRVVAGMGCGNDGPAVVGSKPTGVSPYGAEDMVGNVWEWVEDWYHDTYTGAPSDGSAWMTPTGTSRVLRGGSWYDSPSVLRASRRYWDGPTYGNDGIGFRCGSSAQ